jgi:drug/metabolite transporter (DMT)-like permease
VLGLLGHPYVLIFVATVLWGLSGIYVKFLGVSVFYLASLRTLVPVALIAGWFVWRGTSLNVRAQPKAVWVASALNAVRTICYFVGFFHLPIAQAVVLMYTWPIWVVVLECLFFRVPFERRQFALMVVAFVGILVVQGIGFGVPVAPQNLIASGFLLVAALSNAIMLLLFRKAHVQLGGVQKVFYQNLIGSVVFLPFLPMGLSVPYWKTGVAIACAAVIGICGYAFFFSAMQRMRSSKVALLAYFEILTNIFWGWLLLNEGVTPRIFVGGALILTAAIFMRHESESKSDDVPPQIPTASLGGD